MPHDGQTCGEAAGMGQECTKQETAPVAAIRLRPGHGRSRGISFVSQLRHLHGRNTEISAPYKKLEVSVLAWCPLLPIAGQAGEVQGHLTVCKLPSCPAFCQICFGRAVHGNENLWRWKASGT